MRKAIKSAVTVIILAAVVLVCPTGRGAAAAVTPPLLQGSGSPSADFIAGDYESLVQIVARQWRARVPSFSVQYAGALNDSLVGDVWAYDDPSTMSDLDYLHWNMKSYGATGGGIYTITATFRTTAEQESAVDKAVAAVLQELNVSSAGDYYKIKVVHDYIITRVDYDTELKNRTAYDALISGKAVCQGYALLAYRLLTELGVSARYIYGQAGGGNHAWNIVRIGGFWYNLDVTWDDTENLAGYFLKGDAAFSSDHQRDRGYAAPEFYAAYPMSPVDYDQAVLTRDG